LLSPHHETRVVDEDIDARILAADLGGSGADAPERTQIQFYNRELGFGNDGRVARAAGKNIAPGLFRSSSAPTGHDDGSTGGCQCVTGFLANTGVGTGDDNDLVTKGREGTGC
jgi:hypothetical protein